MPREHHYQTQIRWSGNLGEGTRSYTSYSRAHEIVVEGKSFIQASSDPAFRGDPARYNPEELLVASLSSCHLLSYLHLCAVAKVVVLDYQDSATGTMREAEQGGGQFAEVILHPAVTISPASDPKLAEELHHRAHELCFIARSVNFPVRVEPVIVIG